MTRDSGKKRRVKQEQSRIANEAKRLRKLEREEAVRLQETLPVSSDEVPNGSDLFPATNPTTNDIDSSGPPKSIKPTPVFEGRRVIACSSLIDFTQKVNSHGWICKESVKFAKETVFHGGLCREQTFMCDCGWTVQLASDTGTESLPVNKAVTWGSLAGAVGYDALAVIMAAMDLPFLSKNAYSNHLKHAKEAFEVATEEMRKAGEEERCLAIEANDFVVIDNVEIPWTTVILDGGWDKRTYGHGYNANNGVGVIIGSRSGKVLYTGTRTKTCLICTLAQNKGLEPKVHVCHKNWSRASTAMEADIISQGFRQCIDTHDLVYLKFVGDGDSSTYSAVQHTYSGHSVEKIECYNHALKNFTRKLHDIANDSVKGKNAPRIPKEERQLVGIEDDFKRINLGVRSAIIHNHSLKDEPKQHLKLSDDLYNVLRHVFGEHSQCKDYFCDPKGPRRLEENRLGFMSSKVFFEPLKTAVSRLASMSSSLIQKRNTNRAECFMSVANKYMEGKRKNLGASFLYSLRMKCAVMAFNCNRFWLSKAYRTVCKQEPLSEWSKLERRAIILKKQVPKKRLSKPVSYGFLKTGRSKGDEDYGSDVRQPPLPLDARAHQIQKLREGLSVDMGTRNKIEELTRDQSNSDPWFAHRRTRLTASLAGRIFKLKSTTDNTSILNSIFQQHKGRGTIAMQYGITSENLAVAAYERNQGLEQGTVKKVGLMISLEDGVLGASPDGLIGENGLLEIKCPYSIRNSKPEEWPSLAPGNSSLTFKSGSLQLKKSHNHYYQVVMQIYVTGRDWGDYVVWTPNGIFVERVFRDENTLGVWVELREKLLKFWEGDVAVELVDSRERRKSKEFLCSDEREIGRDRNAARTAKTANEN